MGPPTNILPPSRRHSEPICEEEDDDPGEVESVLSSSPPISSTQSAVSVQPVDWARLKEWTRLSELLVDANTALVDCRDSLGRTALHYAAGYDEVQAVCALVRCGATIDAPDHFGVTPLHWACLRAHVAVVEALLAANADPLVPATAGRNSGRSALDLARAERSERSAQVVEALTSALGAALFEQRKVLGTGSFGTVIKAVRKDTGTPVALKAVRKPPASAAGQGSSTSDGSIALRGALAERDILSSVPTHPFVVQLHCAFQTRGHLYLAIDYCGGGDLSRHIQLAGGRLGELSVRFVGAELLLAIEALHEAGVIHRDIKKENVLVDSAGHIRLADLNAAKRDGHLASGGRTFTVAGTPYTAAPEVLRGQGYSSAADWWSYGVLLFEAIAGRPPFPADGSLTHAYAVLINGKAQAQAQA